MSLLNEIRHNYYPAWPVIQQGKKYALPATKATKTPQRDYAVAVVLPDMQLGYFRTHNNALEPIHDEQALDVALQIVKASKPDQIVLVGDNLDLCEFGKYRYTPAFARTTQAAIDRASQLCAQLRKLAPDARIVWIAGNHEERLGNFILDGAGAAFGLRRGLTP
jgi:metallophosphoesterase superfamily enzyme